MSSLEVDRFRPADATNPRQQGLKRVDRRRGRSTGCCREQSTTTRIETLCSFGSPPIVAAPTCATSTTTRIETCTPSEAADPERRPLSDRSTTTRIETRSAVADAIQRLCRCRLGEIHDNKD